MVGLEAETQPTAQMGTLAFLSGLGAAQTYRNNILPSWDLSLAA